MTKYQELRAGLVTLVQELEILKAQGSTLPEAQAAYQVAIDKAQALIDKEY